MFAVSHFSMVGFDFPIESSAEVGPWAGKFMRTCKATPLNPSDVLCIISDPSGADLRIALRRKGQAADIITINPGFSGEGRTSIEVVADNSDPDFAPFEIGVAARFAGEQTPLILDLADPTQAAAFKPGAKLTVDIAAFSFEPDVFPDEAAFYAAQTKANSKVRLAANYFIPSGSFFERAGGAMANDARRPVAYADFAGKVLKIGHRANVASGKHDFVWAVVQTYDGATLDVVMDTSTLRTEPKVGGIIAGRFWLSARVAPS
ncbi:hypothetical protein [Phenylobacterium sp.]|jgi:hypothetical protein|uniref:hypothetical protein n=1 Tax=Phenylobacterium sp. TaxID=1871053 RepID=UPI002F3E5BC5